MEANAGITLLTPGTVINIPDVSGLPAPYISPQNMLMSTPRGGNPLGYNIVQQPGYQPGLEAQGYTIDPVTGEPVVDTAGLQDYQLPPGDFVQDGTVVGAGGVQPPPDITSDVVDSKYWPEQDLLIPEVKLDGSKQPDQATVEETMEYIVNASRSHAWPTELAPSQMPIDPHSGVQYTQQPGLYPEKELDWRGNIVGEPTWLTGPNVSGGRTVSVAGFLQTLANVSTIAEYEGRKAAHDRKMVRKDPETGDWYWGVDKEEMSYNFPMGDSLRLFADGGTRELRTDYVPEKGEVYSPLDYYTGKYGGTVYDLVRHGVHLYGGENIDDNVESHWSDIYGHMLDTGFITEAGIDFEGYKHTLSPEDLELFLMMKERFEVAGGVTGLSSPDPILGGGGWYGGYGDPYLNYDWGGGGYAGGGSYDQFIMSPALTRWNYS